MITRMMRMIRMIRLRVGELTPGPARGTRLIRSGPPAVSSFTRGPARGPSLRAWDQVEAPPTVNRIIQIILVIIRLASQAYFQRLSWRMQEASRRMLGTFWATCPKNWHQNVSRRIEITSGGRIHPPNPTVTTRRSRTHENGSNRTINK